MGLDYGTGMVPVAAPWVAAALVVLVAVVELTTRATSWVCGLLVACLTVATAVSVSTLLFDALRVVRLVPLPLDVWGLGLRLLLVVGVTSALVPLVRARHLERGRCPACGRWRPGALARLPRWPAILGLIFAVPYPALRITWLLGGTLGTTGSRVDVDPALQLAMASAGGLLVVLAAGVVVDRGPAWLRTLVALAGIAVGSVLAVTFTPAAVGTIESLVAHGLSWSPGGDLMGWVFVLVYCSFALSGVGVALGGLRRWVRRHAECATCWPAAAAG